MRLSREGWLSFVSGIGVSCQVGGQYVGTGPGEWKLRQNDLIGKFWRKIEWGGVSLIFQCKRANDSFPRNFFGIFTIRISLFSQILVVCSWFWSKLQTRWQFGVELLSEHIENF